MDKRDFYPSSPVKADEFLYDDELPFTAFGQFGEGSMDARVFEQDVWWIDIHGQEHLLNEMSTEYLNNVLKHLFSNLQYFHFHSGLRYTIENALSHAQFLPLPENPDGFKEYVENKANPLTLAEATWLNGTPLVKRIYAILDTRSD